VPDVDVTDSAAWGCGFEASVTVVDAEEVTR